ncbi:hypothetical protein Glove_326g97 [Diversispora epigaea]|uniref:Restriction endonuclease type IV Mrr domain-containing protein n=1 Tax=Diversispora epigaea TaxID=1348612 RepID=A0A397HSB4_9GLOM|nr:hypothetical protein Glove_326g97 [Diversispora epigaea]
MPFEIVEFEHIKEETTAKLEERFELFCCELIVRYFGELGMIVTHTGGDGGRDMIVEICGFRIVVQCKVWFKNCINRKEIDKFKTVVWEKNFDFRICVRVLEEKIAKKAYELAENSGGNIIVTIYIRMC